MNRKALIDFIIEAAWDIEGAELDPLDFEEYTDEQLEKEADWYDHLLDK